MMDTKPAEDTATEEITSAVRLEWLAVTCVCFAAAAFAMVFFPLGVIPAGVFAVAGLVTGIVSLIRDPGFNLLALGGTVLSSAAVSTVAVIAILRALG
ncbi:MAG: hypothetical protein ABI275_07765 [Terrimesophilobacter sp.]